MGSCGSVQPPPDLEGMRRELVQCASEFRKIDLSSIAFGPALGSEESATYDSLEERAKLRSKEKDSPELPVLADFRAARASSNLSAPKRPEDLAAS